MKFTKMQGCGNDYVYVNGFTEEIKDKPAFVRAVSDRHFGVGGDGAIFINPSDVADFEMEMYNADGSRSEMCGNGIRCVAKFVYDKGMTDQEHISIVSAGQIKYLDLDVKDGKVANVKVNMGAPILRAKDVPVISTMEESVDEPIVVQDKEYRMTCVSMGNPHAIVFMDDVANLEIEKIGPYFENHEVFPNRTNTEFVEVVDRSHVNMRVWERGTGETLACGTGCCATVVACVLNGLTDTTVSVKVLGGEILIEWDREANLVYMTGPATTVFEGEFPWEE
ncbi:MAG: diaminopimelate epimerase [Lachnospiraceae bacterium]|nr:diaminopimelate epimerase [Lachnospiraceae bacterium]